MGEKGRKGFGKKKRWGRRGKGEVVGKREQGVLASALNVVSC